VVEVQEDVIVEVPVNRDFPLKHEFCVDKPFNTIVKVPR